MRTIKGTEMWSKIDPVTRFVGTEGMENGTWQSKKRVSPANQEESIETFHSRKIEADHRHRNKS